ncbi:CapA family protein [Actinophytocola xanthii]|uniref:Poly-gamma-glutamate biosynthesis protein n=1 Tax=Actinophytocola xanthii TaxID=1912961 RepID=A0A1Q8CTK6_9PSEU|nr:CapA family protein [Actinophytocola xanthii]OLF17706.1 poly-gamma-glutamate biosynthesis protein [Actinophytocola xanthii]
MSRVRASMGFVGGLLLLVAACAPEPADDAPGEVVAPFRSETVLPPPTSAPPPSFTVLATGDVLIHPALTAQAIEDGGGRRDFTNLFAGVRPAVQTADLAICHLEVPLAGPNGPFQGFPLFYAPPEVATALARTGYDTCTTASNHTFDHGAAGVRSTLDALDRAGIRHTGSARTRQEALTPLISEANGVKVGQVSFTFGFNLGTREPEPWMSNELDVNAVLAAARATKRAGAEVVIASLHWGEEHRADPTPEQRSIADRLLADPAVDLVIGHHAHVVQPFEKLHGKWVAYGLGNHVARHEQPRGTTEEGVMARFRFVKEADGWTAQSAEYLPTLVDLGPPIRLKDLSRNIEFDPARADVAIDRIDQVVRARAGINEGLTRPVIG